MATNPDLPSTWTKYRASQCGSCIGTCCTLPVEVRAEDLIRLGLIGEEEVKDDIRAVAKQLIKQKVVESFRASTELFTLARRSNGDCLYLDPLKRTCHVYEKRPGVCRNFWRLENLPYKART